MISRGVEISIAGGGGEIVRALSPWAIFTFFIFIFFIFFIPIFFVRYKNSHAALAMA